MGIFNPGGAGTPNVAGSANKMWRGDAGGDAESSDMTNTPLDSFSSPFKMDLGNFDQEIGGLDVGAGGSANVDAAGATIVFGFNYIAASPSGSRFTAIADINAISWTGAIGDRLYIGVIKKFWANRFKIGTAKTAGTLLTKYWNGAALVEFRYQAIDKADNSHLGLTFLEGAVNDTEYCSFSPRINGDWAAANNVLDNIPNFGGNLFWMCFENQGAIGTPAATIETKVRISDFDLSTGTGFPILWGITRPERHFPIPFSYIIQGSGQPVISDIAVTTTISLPAYVLRNNQTDSLTFPWELADDVDTGGDVELTISYFSTDGGEVDFNIDFKTVSNATTVSAIAVNTGTIAMSDTPSAADQWQTSVDITTTTDRIDISALVTGDSILFRFERDGTADTNSGNVYVIGFTVHYFIWQLGEAQ